MIVLQSDNKHVLEFLQGSTRVLFSSDRFFRIEFDIRAGESEHGMFLSSIATLAHLKLPNEVDWIPQQCPTSTIVRWSV